MRIGLHVRTSGDLRGVPGRAARLGCETIQIFSGNPRSWTKAPLDEQAGRQMSAALAARDIQPLFVHSSYLPNLASPDDDLRERSVDLVADELVRTAKLSARALVLHLGSAGPGATRPARRIGGGIREAYRRACVEPMLLLENSVGAGTMFGSTFVQLGALVAELDGLPIGVALDTAHACAAGYTLHDERSWRRVLDEFAQWIGLERLHLIHGNDLKSACGSRVDRHWHIGDGTIGEQGFAAMRRMPELAPLPLILETPGPEDKLDMRNIRMMKRLVRGEATP